MQMTSRLPQKRNSHIQVDNYITWSGAWKSTFLIELYTIVPLPLMLAWVYFVGLTLDYYGDAEYMAYIKQNPNGTNDFLEPPGFNFTWDEPLRKFEHKMEYWSSTKQTIFCVAFFLGSAPAASMSYAILPMLVFSLEDMKKHFIAKIKHIIVCGIVLIGFFAMVSFVLTKKAMETEDGASTQESINKVGQVMVLVGAAYISQHVCPDYYSSKLRWIFDTIIPNLLVTLVALMLFPQTINPWYADPERSELERSLIALIGPKVVFFLVLHWGRVGARSITKQCGDKLFASGALFVVCFVATFWGRVFLTGLASGSESSGTSLSARSTMIFSCIAFELIDFLIRASTSFRDQLNDYIWDKINGRNPNAVEPVDESDKNINRVKSNRFVGDHATRLYAEVQMIEVYFEVMAVTLFPIFTMMLEVAYLGVDSSKAIESNIVNILIQKFIQMPFTALCFKVKGIRASAMGPFVWRLNIVSVLLIPGFLVCLRYMAPCIIENLSLQSQ